MLYAQKVKCRLWVEQTWEHDPYYEEFISVLEAHFKLKLTVVQPENGKPT